MDFATITGFLLGLLTLLAALFWGGVPIPVIFQPEAILIVLGGTLTALLISFSFQEINRAFASLGKAFKEEEITTDEIADYLIDASVYIRTKGLLAVQPLLSHVDIPFLQRGLQMIVDNQSVDYLKTQLITDMEVQHRAEVQCAKVFEAAGGFAPTMGIIGAIVGLIQVTNMFNSPDQLGHGIASAFIATLYGVGIANMFLLPIAGKLMHRAKSELFFKSMMLQGLIAIREGENPSIIKEKLEAYLQPSASLRQANLGQAEAYPDPVMLSHV